MLESVLNFKNFKNQKLLENYTINDIGELVFKTKDYIDLKGYPDEAIYRDHLNWRNPRKTKELKKEAGLPIATSILYSKPNVITPLYVKWEIGEYGKNILFKVKDIKITKVLIKDINVIQEFVFTNHLTKYKDDNDFVVLFKYEDKYYLNDGNHFVAYMFLLGKKHINAKIINVFS